MCAFLTKLLKQDTELFYTVWLKNRGEGREKKKGKKRLNRQSKMMLFVLSLNTILLVLDVSEARGEIQSNGATEPEGRGKECGEGRE